MKKLLFVDSFEGYRDTWEAEASARGFESVTASDGGEAMLIAKQFQPDILVINWVLLSIECGIEVALDLQEFLPDLETVIVADEVYSETPLSEVQEQAKSKAMLFLEIPYKMNELLNLLEVESSGK